MRIAVALCLVLVACSSVPYGGPSDDAFCAVYIVCDDRCGTKKTSCMDHEYVCACPPQVACVRGADVVCAGNAPSHVERASP